MAGDARPQGSARDPARRGAQEVSVAECLFCKIASGEIPANLVYQDDRLLAFRDVNPQAPMHVLIIPRRHIATLNDLGADDEGIAGAMIVRAAALAKEEGYAERGYRTVFNCN